MYDHIIMFADEAAAHEALAPLGYSQTSGDGAPQWDTSRTLPGVSMVVADAVWDHTDPMRPTVVTPRQVIPGYFIVISLDEINGDLTALPDAACRLVASVEAAAAGQPFIAWTAADLVPATLAAIIRVEPTLSGRQYDFSTLSG